MSVFKKNLEKRKTNKGFGIFAKSTIPKDTIIFEFRGGILTKDNVPNPLKPEDDHYLQIGKDIFIGPSGDFDDYINHSCAPNCGVSVVGHRAFLKSIFAIAKGTEITFDYSTTSTESPDSWTMQCACGAFACRKIISGYESVDEATRERYRALKIIPNYLTEKK